MRLHTAEHAKPNVPAEVIKVTERSRHQEDSHQADSVQLNYSTGAQSKNRIQSLFYASLLAPGFLRLSAYVEGWLLTIVLHVAFEGTMLEQKTGFR